MLSHCDMIKHVLLKEHGGVTFVPFQEIMTILTNQQTDISVHWVTLTMVRVVLWIKFLNLINY